MPHCLILLTEKQNYARPIDEVMKNLLANFTKCGKIVGHSLINEQKYLRG